ncbi:PREDICTED: U-box domain-containing protein 3-like isoform X1 [Tarenaya hassleriana]|uniref:U-box domain-containing protein 3-like isoform X1 n=1 Tax=Tarenaya hassleriana TaxID=28532 RepID=UPI00053C1146|nr:PREDICTED: U-box domain-containing protein 3-like isoform X1 [Tarenaya hassleriana]
MDRIGDNSSSAASSSSSVSSLECESPRGGGGGHELPPLAGALLSSSAAVQRALRLIGSNDPDSRFFAASEIRRLTKTSQRYRRHLSQAVESLVSMLRADSPESHHEAALLALLNLAVKDERTKKKFIKVQLHQLGYLYLRVGIRGCRWGHRVNSGLVNKVRIVEAGALEPIINFLQSDSPTLQEYAAASLLTLSASANNKPIIGAYGAIPLLVKVVTDGNPQARVDAVMALSNLSTLSNNLSMILGSKPIPSILNLLKSCNKSSKAADKCCFLIESLVGSEEGRTELTFSEGGVFAVVEILENGSPQGREHAVGALLTMCESDRSKYREVILREGVIPGLLELTVQGTAKCQTRAQRLLCLLREENERSELQTEKMESIVTNIMCRIEEGEGKAKKMVEEMVRVSMEKSFEGLSRRRTSQRTRPRLRGSKTFPPSHSPLANSRRLSP